MVKKISGKHSDILLVMWKGAIELHEKALSDLCTKLTGIDKDANNGEYLFTISEIERVSAKLKAMRNLYQAESGICQYYEKYEGTSSNVY